MSMSAILATDKAAYDSVIALSLGSTVHGQPSRDQYKQKRRAAIGVFFVGPFLLKKFPCDRVCNE